MQIVTTNILSMLVNYKIRQKIEDAKRRKHSNRFWSDFFVKSYSLTFAYLFFKEIQILERPNANFAVKTTANLNVQL